MKNVVYNEDCLLAMRKMKDNEFDLGIIDAPYFKGPEKPNYYKGTKQICDVGKYDSLEKSWEIPTSEYFNELFRISKNQIIWGCNYYDYKFVGGRIVWIKGVENSPFSMADIAYQSFYKRIDIFKYLWSGFWKEKVDEKDNRIHPTQKPIALYKWLLKNYAKEGDTILDTHVGSGSSRIACWEMGFSFVGYEIDKDYWEAQEKRFKIVKDQIKLF